MNEQQLLDKRASVWAQMKSILDTAGAENRELSGEEVGEYTKAEGDLENLTRQVEIARGHAARADDLDADPSDRPDVPALRMSDDDVETRYAKVFDQYLRYGSQDLEADDRKLLRSRFEGSESRAAGTGTTAGGYLVPPAYRAELIQRMKWFGAVRQVATVIDTGDGAPVQWPTVDDTANVGAILAENTQVTEQDVVFGTATLGAYKYTSKLVRVSLELLQDSTFSVDNLLTSLLAERLGRITNTHYTTGTGTAQPQGIVTGAAVGVTAPVGSTTSVTYNTLIDLIYSIDPAYRNSNVAFMWNDATTAAIRKLRDDSGGAGLGRPLWEPSVRAGEPDSFLAYPVVINNDVAVMAANARSILFGDFRAGYVIRDVVGIQQIRLDERYADFLQVAFLAFLRTDAVVQNTNAYKALVNSAT